MAAFVVLLCSAIRALAHPIVSRVAAASSLGFAAMWQAPNPGAMHSRGLMDGRYFMPGSQAEHDWLAVTFATPRHRWIGITDRRVEGVWEWVSGEPVTFTAWAGNESRTVCSVTGTEADYGMMFERVWVANDNQRCWTYPLPPAQGIIEVVFAASYLTYRSSCGSAVGNSSLVNATLPVIGTHLRLLVDGFSPGKVGYLMVGFSDEYWYLNPLPLDLSALGATGCFLNIDPAITFFVPTNALGQANPAIPIPAVTTLAGGLFFNQFVALDDAPPSRPLRVSFTNAGRGQIGF